MKNCILVFKDKQYYMGQNADLGYVILTDVLENAKQMPFKEADKILRKIKAKEDWQIWIYKSREKYLKQEVNKAITAEIERKEEEIKELKRRLQK
jgi:Tfp pilus assembly PilM family ATPase